MKGRKRVFWSAAGCQVKSEDDAAGMGGAVCWAWTTGKKRFSRAAVKIAVKMAIWGRKKVVFAGIERDCIVFEILLASYGHSDLANTETKTMKRFCLPGEAEQTIYAGISVSEIFAGLAQ